MRKHNEKHLAFLRTLPCLVCQDNTSVEAAHIRYSDASYFKINPGVGQKPDDFYCLPLCGKHHKQQHDDGNERGWWQKTGIDPIKIALIFYAHSGDFEKCDGIIASRAINILARLVMADI